MNNYFLINIFIFLTASCIVVPLASKIRLGSILGFLAAGILIGPFGLGLINNSEQIMYFAEFGIIMMLFVIGLDLDPQTLWRLRKIIIGLGGFQVLLTTILLTAIGIIIGYEWRISMACAMALALSSTALVLKMLQEKGLMKTPAGESALSVLLFQDIAVIPILVILPLLAGSTSINNSHNNQDLLSDFNIYLRTIIVAAVVAFIIFIGRRLSRHIFHYIAAANLREIFTAISLALIVGVTLLMKLIGISPALGAFIAGLVLANSEYRHSLETDIEPFKGLFLGLFFISIGMGMNFSIILHHPLQIIAALMLLIISKTLILLLLGRIFKLPVSHDILFALSLAQGGEFAFLLFQYSQSINLLNSYQSNFLTLVVALSMAVTPILMIFNEKFIVYRFMSRIGEPKYDNINENNPVIIAGYGRFGQVIGRFLSTQGIKITILEKNPEQVELLRRYGISGYFGDASRLDLLRSAGANQARLLIVAVDDADKCLEIVQIAKNHFPKLKIFARARNRHHAYELNKIGVDYYRREVFDSSVTMAQEVMSLFGQSPEEIQSKVHRFVNHDEKTLKKSFEFFEEEKELINFYQQTRGELEAILAQDINANKNKTDS